MNKALPVQVALLGDPVGHSVSPAMHHAAAQALGLSLVYTARRVPRAELSEVILEIRGDSWLGANVTLPHKLAALALVDDASVTARRAGAINTLYKRGDRLLGENTDVPALARCLRELLDPRPTEEHILVLGAGGAARATVVALLDMGVAHVQLYNRSHERAMTLVSDLRAVTDHDRLHVVPAGNLQQQLRRSSLVINATSVGLDGVSSPLPDLSLPAGARVFDLVYGPDQTPVVRQALQAGNLAIDGLWMLVYQAAASFRLWTGQQPPERLMYEAALAALQVRRSSGSPQSVPEQI